MEKKYDVVIPSGICGNPVGALFFNEDTWPQDSEAHLKVVAPLTCKISEIEVVCDSKRAHRRWVLEIKPTKHLNHTYPVRITLYEKTKK